MADRFTRSVIASFNPGLDPKAAKAAVTEPPPVEPPLYLVRGFIRAASATSLAPDTRLEIARRWASRVAGKQKSSTSATCRELNALDWSWPSFDIVADGFKSDDLWPTPWHHYKEKILNGDDIRDVRAKILIASARTAATSVRNGEDKQFMTMLRLEGWHIYTDSEVGAHFASQVIGHVDPSDWSTWPPFYPGDQSVLKRGGDGVHSRFGRFYGLGVKPPFWADPFN